MARAKNITIPVTITASARPTPATGETDEQIVRDALRLAGLLPDPAGMNLTASAAGRVGRNRKDMSPAVAELERVIRNLSCDLSEARLDVAHLQQYRYHQDEQLDRVVEALEWIRDSYDLDQIALDVIEHAILNARSNVVLAG